MQKIAPRHDQLTNRTPAQLVAQVTTHNDSRTSVGDKTPEKPPKVNLTEIKEFRAELAAIRESMDGQSNASPHPQYNPMAQGRARPKGCWSCERQGRDFHCNHCFNCGDVGHFSYQCLKPSQRSHNPTSLQGNRPGLSPRERE